MGRAKGIVFAFRALGEPVQPTLLAQRANAVAAPGQYLVGIGLVPDVPDQPILRRVENMVQGDRQFDHAQTGPQVPAGDGDGAHRLGAEFIGELLELFRGEATNVRRHVHRVQQRGRAVFRQVSVPVVFADISQMIVKSSPTVPNFHCHWNSFTSAAILQRDLVI